MRGAGDTDDVVGRARADLTMPAPSALQRLVETSDGVGPAIGRLGLGLVILPHALQKVAGMFGGHGLSATYAGFTQQLHIPGPLAFLAIAMELVSSIALILGVFTRLAALGIVMMMVGAIAYVHLPNGYFMNWYGTKAGEGFEFHLLAIALGLTLMVLGGGRASIDRLFMGRRPMHGGSVPKAITVE
jgi:putative oxidoreductase